MQSGATRMFGAFCSDETLVFEDPSCHLSTGYGDPALPLTTDTRRPTTAGELGIFAASSMPTSTIVLDHSAIRQADALQDPLIESPPVFLEGCVRTRNRQPRAAFLSLRSVECGSRNGSAERGQQPGAVHTAAPNADARPTQRTTSDYAAAPYE
jgi:hypothetical protein